MSTQQMQELAQHYIQRYWVGGLDKKLPVTVTLLAILLLAQSMANLTWRLVPQPEITDSPTPTNYRQPVANAPRQQASVPQGAMIAQWNLFGKVEIAKPKPKPIEDITTAPPTKLNLKLRGLFASSNKKTARAIIADAKQKEESYAIGDDIPGGVKLHDILADRVILDRNGKFETLELPKDIPAGVLASTSNRGSAANTRTSRRNQRTAIDSSKGDNGALLRQYRDALLNDPQSVMGLIRAQPYSKGGKLLGYRIKPGKDRHLLRRFGLRSGDVVTSVNGVPMNNPIKALEVLRDLSSASQLTVDVERNGTPQTFTFQINE